MKFLYYQERNAICKAYDVNLFNLFRTYMWKTGNTSVSSFHKKIVSFLFSLVVGTESFLPLSISHKLIDSWGAGVCSQLQGNCRDWSGLFSSLFIDTGEGWGKVKCTSLLFSVQLVKIRTVVHLPGLVWFAVH